MTHRLSKSRFVTGWFCPRWLWWKVHEPDAGELEADPAALDRMEQGNEVGLLATLRYPGGVPIDLPYEDFAGKLAATRKALEDGAPAIFEAAFMEDDVFVAVDVLERLDGGFRLIEVKSSSGRQNKHLPDAAIQTHVVRRAGLDVRQVVLMQLNKEHRRPGRGDLFVLDDLTEEVEALLPDVPRMIREQLDVLAGPDPGDCIGERCAAAKGECPFEDRCWPEAPDHVRRLHRVGLKKALALMARGVESFADVDGSVKLGATATRQLEAWRAGELVVEPGLERALEPFRARPLGFLDFETVQRALPPWDGLGPWAAVPVQFSYHERGRDGSLTHTAWLAEGSEDPRRPLARALLDATDRAERVVTYSSYERTQIRSLVDALPDLAGELGALEAKLLDLKPIVEHHVMHPAFGGSFSIKDVLPALVPELTYEGLEVAGGQVASVELARLLLRGGEVSDGERAAKRTALLDYCALDTMAMVRLLGRLEEIAGLTPLQSSRSSSAHAGSKRP